VGRERFELCAFVDVVDPIRLVQQERFRRFELNDSDDGVGGNRAIGVALAIGFVAGLGVAALFWRKHIPALLNRARSYDRQPSTVKHAALIINRWSGDGKAERYKLEDAANKIGVRTIMLERGLDLAQLAHDAISTGADAIGMAGGDGSLGLVAGVAIERGVPFFCVPVGTRNHFALDLGLDRDNPLSALEALQDGEEIRIDYAVANTRLFLNNVSFGVYAQAVHRDGFRQNKEETMAAVLREAASDVEAQAAIRYATPNGERHERAPLLLISNNVYQMSGPPDYGRRPRLDTGKLGVGAVTNLPEDADLNSITLEQLRTLHTWETGSIRLESDEPILAGLDGEALKFESPLDISVRPKGLRVIVPRGTEPGYVSRSEAVAARLVDMAKTGGNWRDA
jgi:diacylglycerol kinase family enzyme